MAPNENNSRKDLGDENRNLEPDYDDDKPAKAPSNSGFISKFLRPATFPKRPKIAKIGDGINFDDRLKWAKFVNNPNILNSSNRDKLKQYLDELLAGLNQRYIESPDPIFPSNFELTKLTEVVTVLGKLLGIQKADFGDLLSAMKRIENRWSKAPLIKFADDLRDRLLRLPVCPASVVYQAAKINPDHETTLCEIKKFISDKLKADATTPWEKWWNTISELQFDTSSSFLTTNQKMFATMFSKANVAQKKLLAYFWMMNLQRQQLVWDKRHANQIQASLQWIYLLLRQKDYDLLAQVFCGDATPPDKVKNVLATLGNRERRNRSYRKNASSARKATSLK